MHQEYSLLSLTHWGRVTHIRVIKLGHHWPAPSYYLNQCWNIVNWALGNKFQWNFNQNTTFFIEENGFEYVVWKLTAILSRPQCVNNNNTDNGSFVLGRWPHIVFQYHKGLKWHLDGLKAYNANNHMIVNGMKIMFMCDKTKNVSLLH